jgi:serine/threonine protein kinase
MRPIPILMSLGPDTCPASSAQVSDFGLARLMSLQGRITTDTYGTVTHMPPELLTGGDLSPAVVRIIGSPLKSCP